MHSKVKAQQSNSIGSTSRKRKPAAYLGGHTSDNSISGDEYIRQLKEKLSAREKEHEEWERCRETLNRPIPSPERKPPDSSRKEFDMEKFDEEMKLADRKFKRDLDLIEKRRHEPKNKYVGNQLDRLTEQVMKECPFGGKEDFNTQKHSVGFKRSDDINDSWLDTDDNFMSDLLSEEEKFEENEKKRGLRKRKVKDDFK